MENPPQPPQETGENQPAPETNPEKTTESLLKIAREAVQNIGGLELLEDVEKGTVKKIGGLELSEEDASSIKTYIENLAQNDPEKLKKIELDMARQETLETEVHLLRKQAYGKSRDKLRGAKEKIGRLKEKMEGLSSMKKFLARKTFLRKIILGEELTAVLNDQEIGKITAMNLSDGSISNMAIVENLLRQELFALDAAKNTKNQKEKLLEEARLALFADTLMANSLISVARQKFTEDMADAKTFWDATNATPATLDEAKTKRGLAEELQKITAEDVSETEVGKILQGTTGADTQERMAKTKKAVEKKLTTALKEEIEFAIGEAVEADEDIAKKRLEKVLSSANAKKETNLDAETADYVLKKAKSKLEKLKEKIGKLDGMKKFSLAAGVFGESILGDEFKAASNDTEIKNIISILSREREINLTKPEDIDAVLDYIDKKLVPLREAIDKNLMNNEEDSQEAAAFAAEISELLSTNTLSEAVTQVLGEYDPVKKQEFIADRLRQTLRGYVDLKEKGVGSKTLPETKKLVFEILEQVYREEINPVTQDALRLILVELQVIRP